MERLQAMRRDFSKTSFMLQFIFFVVMDLMRGDGRQESLGVVRLQLSHRV